ncbi:MAG: hypothetical protein ACE5KM_03100 [Planctomycetaceae bacterium]
MALTVAIQQPSPGSSHSQNAPFTVKAKVTGGIPAVVRALVSQSQQVVLTENLLKTGPDIWEGAIDPSGLNVGAATLDVEALVVDGVTNMTINITGSPSSSSSSSSGP